MFGRGSRKRLSSRSLTASGEPERGQPCNTCGDQCPGFALHKWRIQIFHTSLHVYLKGFGDMRIAMSYLE
ncbi:hypothetical protein TURU_100675 [Turdus rufiventris]|nr:hypothetical protein TURU_100675 [Turdus rufiventris]